MLIWHKNDIFPLLYSPTPKARLVEGSEFLNEQDSAKVVSGLNGKSNQWSFEELIDLNVHSKTHPLIETEDCNQVLISCDGSSDGPRVAFEDKGTPVNTLHSSNQPLEAMSGELHLMWRNSFCDVPAKTKYHNRSLCFLCRDLMLQLSKTSLLCCTREVPVQLSSCQRKSLTSSGQLPLFLLQREEHEVKQKHHPKCYVCTLNDEEQSILKLYKGYASGKFHIFLQCARFKSLPLTSSSLMCLDVI